MQYISRRLDRKFMKMSEFFKAVLVTGARQVGKTTLLRHLTSGQSRAYVTLDNRAARELAQEDPALFFQTYKPPVLIDEVQFAPNLFPQIKTLCDESEETGLFWLTGSQQYQLMEVARESLAGRMSILTLYGLSQAEKAGVDFGDTLDFSLACLLKRQKQVERNDVAAVYEHIWQGGMPQIFHADPEQRQEYYHSYLNTYIMRDIAELGDVTDTLRFGKFITACAALVGQMVNYRTLAEASDISEPTAKNWLYLLEGLGIVFLLRPYANNALKRLVKTPKLYFCDTGLAAHLSMWPTAQTLQNGAASGAFFENYVVMELLKGHASAPITANMSYYRDSNMKEIDLFVETNGRIHPLEIKKSATPDRREIKKFSILEKTTLETGEGGIVCMCQEPMPIDALNCYIPCNLI